MEKINCPNCEKKVKDSNYCSECGEELKDVVELPFSFSVPFRCGYTISEIEHETDFPENISDFDRSDLKYLGSASIVFKIYEEDGVKKLEASHIEYEDKKFYPED